MERNHETLAPTMNDIVAEIKTVLDSARSNVARLVRAFHGRIFIICGYFI